MVQIVSRGGSSVARFLGVTTGERRQKAVEPFLAPTSTGTSYNVTDT